MQASVRYTVFVGRFEYSYPFVLLFMHAEFSVYKMLSLPSSFCVRSNHNAISSMQIVHFLPESVIHVRSLPKF